MSKSAEIQSGHQEAERSQAQFGYPIVFKWLSICLAIVSLGLYILIHYPSIAGTPELALKKELYNHYYKDTGSIDEGINYLRFHTKWEINDATAVGGGAYLVDVTFTVPVAKKELHEQQLTQKLWDDEQEFVEHSATYKVVRNKMYRLGWEVEGGISDIDYVAISNASLRSSGRFSVVQPNERILARQMNTTILESNAFYILAIALILGLTLMFKAVTFKEFKKCIPPIAIGWFSLLYVYLMMSGLL
ncbi:MAG: hypothetical protein C9356_15300 [Oleiphilus sp.]|nr:MAG: hypothetical protein C9356_15300 [Oleiphilus sp.]